MTYRNAEEFSNNIAVIKNTLRAENEQKQNMLYYLMDFENFSI